MSVFFKHIEGAAALLRKGGIIKEAALYTRETEEGHRVYARYGGGFTSMWMKTCAAENVFVDEVYFPDPDRVVHGDRDRMFYKPPAGSMPRRNRLKSVK